jgi:hypothetical protein
MQASYDRLQHNLNEIGLLVKGKHNPIARAIRELVKDSQVHLEAIYGEVALAEDQVPTIDSELPDDGLFGDEHF